MYKSKKQNRHAKKLHAKTMLSFLSLLYAYKRKVTLEDFVRKIETKYSLRETRIRHAIAYLDRYEYIKKTKASIHILEKGVLYIESARVKKNHWDRRFRVLLLTSLLPTNTMHYIRARIRAFGFIKIDRGVWVYPYDCLSFIQLLQLEYRTGEKMLYFVAQDNETLARARKEWKLR